MTNVRRLLHAGIATVLIELNIVGYAAAFRTGLDIRTVGTRSSSPLGDVRRGKFKCSGSGDFRNLVLPSAANPLNTILNDDRKWKKGGLVREWELPLNGERILYTTPRQFAAKLSSALVEAGAQPMWCPSVRFSPLIETSAQALELDQVLQTLPKFDAIAFASRHGVNSLCDRMEAIFGGAPAMLQQLERSGVRIAALPSAADAVRARLGAPADIVADDEDALAAALAAAGPRARVLCPTPAFLNITAPPSAAQAARAVAARGLNAVRAPAYLVRPGDVRAHRPELAALAQGAVDVVSLTSPVEVSYR
jgi:uroporphyrinogen-III synthase